MFERKFEFTVYHPLEVCEERVHNMKTPGCLTRLFQPLSAEIVPHEDYAKFFVFQSLGQRAGYARLEGVIEPISEIECAVSGVADVRNIWFMIIFFTLVGLAMLAEGIHEQAWWLIIFVTIWYSLMWLLHFHYRNRLIKTLEKALNQPKKKKHEVV
jgi:hypothetical protein